MGFALNPFSAKATFLSFLTNIDKRVLYVKSVEDEIHFLMYCPKFENHRKELFSNVLNYNVAILSAEDKFVWILSNEDPSCVRELAKFIHSCFQMAP